MSGAQSDRESELVAPLFVGANPAIVKNGPNVGYRMLAAEEDLRVQQERYRLGASTIVDVLTSQEALNQAEVDAVTARFDYVRARAQISALIGRTL